MYTSLVYSNLFVSTVVMLILDVGFLSMNADMFKIQIADVQHSPLKLNPIGALLSYMFLIFGLNYFILSPHRSILDAFLFGFVIYGVYETTTLALLHKWRFSTVIIDTLWGGTLFALTTFITYKIV